MSTETPLLLALDFTGTFVFALNGALTAVRAERLDIFGVITLGMFTGLGGGTIRDVLLDALPPATFVDWRFLALAAGGGLIAFALSRRLERLTIPITVLDAVGLSVFAVLGAEKALNLGFGVVQAMIVGTITAVGGGTIRDVMIGRIPTVLRSELYAIPALIGAGCAAATTSFGYQGTLPALGAGGVLCDPDDRRPFRPRRAAATRAPLTDAWIADRADSPRYLPTGGLQKLRCVRGHGCLVWLTERRCHQQVRRHGAPTQNCDRSNPERNNQCSTARANPRVFSFMPQCGPSP